MPFGILITWVPNSPVPILFSTLHVMNPSSQNICSFPLNNCPHSLLSQYFCCSPCLFSFKILPVTQVLRLFKPSSSLTSSMTLSLITPALGDLPSFEFLWSLLSTPLICSTCHLALSLILAMPMHIPTYPISLLRAGPVPGFFITLVPNIVLSTAYTQECGWKATGHLEALEY